MATIELPQRQYLGGGAGNKGLVGDVQLIAGDAALLHLHAQHLTRQSDHAVPGDPLQAGGDLRGVQHPVSIEKDIGRAGLGHVAFGVKHDRLVKARLHRGIQCQHAVDVVAAGLGPTGADIDVMARPGRGQGPEPDGSGLGADVGSQVPGHHHHLTAQRLGAQPKALGTEKHGGLEIGIGQSVADQALALRLDQLFMAPGHLEVEDMGAVQQASGMLVDPKQPGIAVVVTIGAHPLEAAHAIVQRVGQQMGRGLPPGQPFAVLPDPAVALVQSTHVPGSLSLFLFASLSLPPPLAIASSSARLSSWASVICPGQSRRQPSISSRWWGCSA